MATLSTPRVHRHRAARLGIEYGGETLAGETRRVFAEVLARNFGIQMSACLRFAGLITDDAVARAAHRAVIMAIGRDYRVFEAPSIDRLPSAAAGAAMIFNLSGTVAEARQRLAARGGGDAD